jgi:hypothetical protein
MYISSFIKIGSGIQTFMGGEEYTDTQTGLKIRQEKGYRKIVEEEEGE